MIRNLLFDMGGVIFDQDTQEAFRRFEAIGIDTEKYMGKVERIRQKVEPRIIVGSVPAKFITNI